MFSSGSESSYPLEDYLIHLNRMFGLGVIGITLKTDGFLTNKKGFPTLSKKMQSVVEFIMKRGGEKVRTGARRRA